MMMVPRVDDEVEIDGRWIALTGAEYEDGRIGGETARHLKQFRWEWQTPAGGRWSIWLRNNWSRPSAWRSLAPGHRDYKPAYDGDLRSRDAAHHQRTVWAGLIGHYIDAWLKVYNENERARVLLSGFEPHLREAGIGTISEIFDAEHPYCPRGGITQAWSVAEVLRASVNTAG